MSGKISVKPCVVPEKIQHYATNIVGRAIFATLRASEAQKQKLRATSPSPDFVVRLTE